MSTKINLDYLRKMGAIIKLQGKEYTTHQGLLYVAHQQGITSIITELVSEDADKRRAVFKATAVGDRGAFTGWGDADPSNVGKMIANAYLRMAETRSVSRALRLYLGIGMTAMDELPGKEQETPAIPPLAPEPVVEPEPVAQYVAVWTDEQRKAFHSRRAQPDIGLGKPVGYEVIKQLCKNLERPMPKHMGSEQRKRLFSFLADPKNKKHIEDAETIVDYHTHAKGE